MTQTIETTKLPALVALAGADRLPAIDRLLAEVDRVLGFPPAIAPAQHVMQPTTIESWPPVKPRTDRRLREAVALVAADEPAPVSPIDEARRLRWAAAWASVPEALRERWTAALTTYARLRPQLEAMRERAGAGEQQIFLEQLAAQVRDAQVLAGLDGANLPAPILACLEVANCWTELQNAIYAEFGREAQEARERAAVALELFQAARRRYSEALAEANAAAGRASRRDGISLHGLRALADSAPGAVPEVVTHHEVRRRG